MLLRTKASLGLLALAAGTALVSCSGRADTKTSSALKSAKQNVPARKPAPEFSLQDAEGKSVQLSSLRGKVVLLNFWATWCGPCALEIPWFIEFEQDYRSRGLEVVGVSMDEDGWQAIKPFVQQHKMNYRVLLGNDSVGQLYGGVDSLPTSFIIDRQGNVAYVHVGLVGKNEYQDEIQNLLASGTSTARNNRKLDAPPAMLIAGSAR